MKIFLSKKFLLFCAFTGSVISNILSSLRDVLIGVLVGIVMGVFVQYFPSGDQVNNNNLYGL
jgi:ABC-type nitrate/sulfonate/bicarbonate transport system permease component